MRKKKILYHSDWSLAKTGFARAAKELLTYLYNTGKYDIVHYCCAIGKNNPILQKTPWRSIGSAPEDPAEIARINADQNLARDVGYGGYFIDQAIQEEKPDLYISSQDPWAFGGYYNKKWFKNITTLGWVTLDSLPLYDEAVTQAKNYTNYWIWSNFANADLDKLGIKTHKTVHGPVNHEKFKNLGVNKKLQIRQKYNISPEAFIIGFVFRNQLRKSVPNLLEGVSLFKKQNPQIKNVKLLLHTHWSEGWDIPKLAKEYNIDLTDILTTYVCGKCKNYFLHHFVGQEVRCGQCNTEKSCNTTNTGFGVSEDQLNEVYNVMDVYVHPFTSGGQEIPIQEAKYCELTTLVTNYSCGEELCAEESGSLPLEWSEYREHGTQFRKASTYPSSIAKQLLKFYNWTPQQKIENGRKSRKWCLENYSVEVIGKIFEEYIDSIPFTNYNFIFEEEKKDPSFEIPFIADNAQWLITMYKGILKMTVDESDSGHQHWMKKLKDGMPRKNIEDYFRQVAIQENQKNTKVDFEDLLGKEGRNNRILITMPESLGDVFLTTSLLPSIKETYPNHNIYFATKRENFSLLDGNSYIYKVLEYIPQMDNLLWLEGNGDHPGYFQIAFLAHLGTQRILNYIHCGEDKIQFDIK